MEEIKSFLPPHLSNIVNEYAKELLAFAYLTKRINIDGENVKTDITTFMLMNDKLYNILERFTFHEFDDVFELQYSELKHIDEIIIVSITDPITIDKFIDGKSFVPNIPNLFKIIEKRIVKVFPDIYWIKVYMNEDDEIFSLFQLYVELYDYMLIAEKELEDLYTSNILDDIEYNYLKWLITPPSFNENHILARMQMLKNLTVIPKDFYIQKYILLLDRIKNTYADPKYLDINNYNIEKELEKVNNKKYIIYS